MKKNIVTLCLIFSSTLYTVSTLAHDPKEHMEQAAKLDCAPMEKMDHSKMDMNDPVMLAMMKKCMGKMKHDQSNSTKGAGEANENHVHDHQEDLSNKSDESSSHENGTH
ncbi:hypothetical protein [Marinagarivorans cellulosilyticus]|uniref:Pentapeptide MXKDX repeat protein n=1 Tax=Marinagarivorans cellulosilyticus TaxID=2721545 RepID=A0AAN1WJF0_9GAMM|nr:hypothetical protein [Marinagarivorans cellulosilyticus]BCD98694.1 hypothetical protein MARGE09_P2895 [Marinagarivorans cellulosilyticus]